MGHRPNSAILKIYLDRQNAKFNTTKEQILTIMDQATLVCSHVLKDVSCAQFICHDLSGWVAGCSEDCLNNAGIPQLGMVCLLHLTNIEGLPEWFYEAPPNFAFLRSEHGWQLQYHDGDTDDISESDDDLILAAPQESDLRKLPQNSVVKVIALTDHTLAVLRFDDTGLRTIPFWRSPNLPQEMLSKMNGTEKLVDMPLQQVKHDAMRGSINFLLADHLSDGPGSIILVNES